MTTIAMVGGMLPSALALGAGGEFRAPMAIAVIGGLISSTLLSLVFVPAVFVLMDDMARRCGGCSAASSGPTDDAAQGHIAPPETSHAPQPHRLPAAAE